MPRTRSSHSYRDAAHTQHDKALRCIVSLAGELGSWSRIGSDEMKLLRLAERQLATAAAFERRPGVALLALCGGACVVRGTEDEDDEEAEAAQQEWDPPFVGAVFLVSCKPHTPRPYSATAPRSRPIRAPTLTP